MAVLSDRELRAMFPDSPYISAASIDLHVGDALLVWPRWEVRDPRRDQSDLWQAVETAPLRRDAPDDLGWRLQPNTRYLAATHERVRILPHLAGQIAARSSWGRDGLAVICGPAGWLDPGFEGNVTLELSVVGSTLLLRPGDRIAQLVLCELTSSCLAPYAGKYQHQIGAVPSRSYLDGAP